MRSAVTLLLLACGGSKGDGTANVRDEGEQTGESASTGETGAETATSEDTAVPATGEVCGEALDADPDAWGYVDAGQPPVWLDTDDDTEIYAGTVVCASPSWSLVSSPATPATSTGPDGTAWRLEAEGETTFRDSDGTTRTIVAWPGRGVAAEPYAVQTAIDAGKVWLVLEPGGHTGGFQAEEVHLAGHGRAVLRVFDELADAAGLLDLRDLEVNLAAGNVASDGTLRMERVRLHGSRRYSAYLAAWGAATVEESLLETVHPLGGAIELVDTDLVDGVLMEMHVTWTRGNWYGHSVPPLIYVAGGDPGSFTLTGVRVGPGDHYYRFYGFDPVVTLSHLEVDPIATGDLWSPTAVTIEQSLYAGEPARTFPTESGAFLEDAEWIVAEGCPRERRHAATSAGRDAGTDTDLDGSAGDLGAPGGPYGVSDPDWVVDDDADGLPTSWEERWGLDPATDDAGDDPDGDGLTNADEFAFAGDPRKANRDGDALGDAAEAEAGTCAADAWDLRPTVRVRSVGYVLAGEPAWIEASAEAPEALGPVTYAWEAVSGDVTFTDPTDPRPGAVVYDNAQVVVRACAGEVCTDSDYVSLFPVGGAVVSTQDELDTAAADATVFLIVVAAGTYGPVTLGPNQSLVAADGAEVSFDAAGADVAITMSGPYLAGVTVTGAALHGVVLDGTGTYVYDAEIVDNGNDADGGGILSVGGSLAMEDVMFRDNRGRLGGALYASDDAGYVECQRCAFVENGATDGGGAAWIAWTPESWKDMPIEVRILRTVLFGNTAATGAAGLGIDGGDVLVRGLTAVGNSGGAALASDDAFVLESLFVDNDRALELGDDAWLYRTLLADNADSGFDLARSSFPLTDRPDFVAGAAEWDTSDLRLSPGSAGAGHAYWGYDGDGTTADVGAYGGPGAVGWITR